MAARQAIAPAEAPHAAASRAAHAALAKMTPDEVRATFVRAGIYTTDGKLTEAFGGRRSKKRRKAAAKPTKRASRRRARP